jgi:hypothetical protein
MASGVAAVRAIASLWLSQGSPYRFPVRAAIASFAA